MKSAMSSTGTLKKDALGFGELIVASVASTGPAYSLATSIGLLSYLCGVNAVGALMVGFVAMFLAAVSGSQLNRVMPEAGSGFAWTTEVLGSSMGFLAGISIIFVGLAVTGIFAQIASAQLFVLVGWKSAMSSTTTMLIVSTAILALATVPAYLGVQLSLRLETVLLLGEIVTLLIVGGLTAAYSSPAAHFSLGWFSPFKGGGSLLEGVLVVIFMYGGWEVATFLAEEAKNGAVTAGRAAMLSPLLLMLLYVFVTTSVLHAVGPRFLANAPDGAALAAVGAKVFPGPFEKLVALAIFVSALAAVEASMLAQARTFFAMARRGALPAVLARTSTHRHSPHVATVVSFVLAAVWLIGFGLLSPSFLNDSLLAMGITYVVFYGLACLSCVVRFWRGALRSWGRFATQMLAPLIAIGVFGAVLIQSVIDFTKRGPDVALWLGVQPPLVIAVGVIVFTFVWVGVGKATRIRYFTHSSPASHRGETSQVDASEGAAQ
jgi:amino acid transporter